jgi:hypothetical protein
MAKDIKDVSAEDNEQKVTEKKPSVKYTGPALIRVDGSKQEPATWTVEKAREMMIKYPKMFKHCFTFKD